MKPMQYCLTLFASLTLLSACSEQIDIDLGETGDPRLVVFTEITNEAKPHAVYLSKSMPYFYNEKRPGISNAKVSVGDGFDTVQLTEDPSEPGTYYTPADFAGIPGKTYYLEINRVDINGDGAAETYTAQTIMKNVTPVEQVSVLYNSFFDGWEVALYASEPEATKDFYLFKVYKNGVLFTDTISNYWVVDDRFFNGTRIEDAVVQYFDEEKGEIVGTGDKVTLEMAGITEEYYDFITQVQTEISGKIPMFSGPSANVKGNISNGALGFFAVMAVSRQSCVCQ